MENLKTVPFTIRFIATGFFTGYSPLAPGSVGSILALLIFFVFSLYRSVVFVPVILITFVLGIYASSIIEKYLGDDPSIVVIDEMVGMWVSLVFLPENMIIWIVAFFIFRVIDIIKPFPCRQSESLKRGWGIMLDDVIAGIYTNLILQISIVALKL